MVKLLLLAGAIAAWFAFFVFRTRDRDRKVLGLLLTFGGSVFLGALSYYLGAILWTFRYGA